MKVGDAAPELELKDQEGRPVRLSSLRGRWVVLFFYPKDHTLICTKEACGFRDAYAAFREAGAEVLGVSADPPESHRGFAGAHGLPYRLLSDPDGEARRLFGVGKRFGFLPGRVTFVLAPDGTVRARLDSAFRASAHVEDALRAVREGA